MTIQEPVSGERDFTDNSTTSSPSSTSTAITIVNDTFHPHTHPHPNPSIHHVHQPIPPPSPFSIRQTFSAYPNIDLFSESGKSSRNYNNMHNLAQEAREAIPETDRMGVRLQNPEDLLRRRLRERRRKPVDFRNTVLLHVYDLEGGKDVPTREESTIFHGDGDANCGGPWPRNKEAKWEIGVDRMFLEQAKFCEKRWRYDSVKKTDVENKLVEGKDLSGREERMKEKALAKREERLREEMKVEAKEEERLREEAEVGED